MESQEKNAPPTTKKEMADRILEVEKRLSVLLTLVHNETTKTASLYNGLRHTMLLNSFLVTTLIKKGVITEKELMETAAEEKKKMMLDAAMKKAGPNPEVQK